MQPALQPPAVSVAIAVAQILTALVFSVAALWVARVVLRRINKGMDDVCPDARSKWIALVIALLLVPGVVQRLMFLIPSLAWHLAIGIPGEMRRGAVAVMCDRPELAECASDYVGGAFIGLGTGVSTMLEQSQLQYFPVWQVVLLITIWMAVAMMVGDRTPGLAGNPLTRLSATARQNVALAVVLAAASYTSIAAIAAIPIIQEPVVDAREDVARFRMELEAPGRAFNPRKTEDVEKDNPFKQIQETLQARAGAAVPPPSVAQQPPVLPASVQAAAAPATRTVDRDIEQVLEYGLQDRASLITEARKHRDHWTKIVDAARTQAITTFDRNADRPGNFERGQHYFALLAWYDRSRIQAEREVNECVAAIETFDRAAQAWSESSERALRRVNDSGDAADFRPSYTRFSDALSQCQQRWIMGDPPERALLGSRLGPFRWIADWLVATESISLVAVVGMLGFGLFGAACSTIIREGGAVRPQHEPLVKDLPSVVVRGLSAAIVVFLAVKGGLAVFASATSEPNPYVLLLTCLIAAVFSEPVWERARAYLTDAVEKWGGAKPPSPPPSDQTTT